jgi:inhibitor of KinA
MARERRMLHPIGDQGILVHLPDESAAIRYAAALRNANFSWLIDIVPAYASVGVFYDSSRIKQAEAHKTLESIEAGNRAEATTGKQHVIPCCYEMQLDLQRVAEHTNLTSDEVIRRHSDRDYTVYAIGFAPGFPYLGYLPAELCGVPRLSSPRLRVESGSVGLTGKQTGIYPQVRPGGWNLIGRTPLTLVDVADNYFPLRVGDRVRFQRIDEAEFNRLRGERLVFLHS